MGVPQPVRVDERYLFVVLADVGANRPSAQFCKPARVESDVHFDIAPEDGRASGFEATRIQALLSHPAIDSFSTERGMDLSDALMTSTPAPPRRSLTALAH